MVQHSDKGFVGRTHEEGSGRPCGVLVTLPGVPEVSVGSTGSGAPHFTLREEPPRFVWLRVPERTPVATSMIPHSQRKESTAVSPPSSSSASATPKPKEGRLRVRIENIQPQIDGGSFPARGIVGDRFQVEADIFADGHDRIEARLLYRRLGARRWNEAPMELLGNDHWVGSFDLEELGVYQFMVEGWVDPVTTWCSELERWIGAGADISLELQEGAALLERAAGRAKGDASRELAEWVEKLRDWSQDPAVLADPGLLLRDPIRLTESVLPLYLPWADRSWSTRPRRSLSVRVDRERARFSSWYEFFPRSTSAEAGVHGTFADAAEALPRIRDMGFDVVYLPPIHPVGHTNRKGPNNRVVSAPGDPGSPWAIGGPEGGHTAVHPDLGTLDDFRSFRERAEELGMEVALDVAFQCSPDHPWVREHPQWFRHRTDGSIRYAENPPKKYEDIYPIDFETDDWEALWDGLRDVFLFWMDQGVRIFRVDNPHTKAFPFWEWVIQELLAADPGVILLSEAFTRPRRMYHLAKVGFHQSYTYFAWRDTGPELAEYMRELESQGVREFFRPNFWPNTPDILTETLQTGGRPAFMVRLVLAATLTANYGIYGPTFELLEHIPREEGSEEYLDSEKYQLRSWDLDRPGNLTEFIARVNRIRRENAPLQRNDGIRFHPSDNETLLVFSKSAPDVHDRIVVVVNTDHRFVQSGWIDLDLAELGLEGVGEYQVHDLLAGGRYTWSAGPNFVRLDPGVCPAHIFRIEAPATVTALGAPTSEPQS